ncbi:MAG: hypothetical protein ACRCWS_08960 [Propionibacteriaceae bacterium]
MGAAAEAFGEQHVFKTGVAIAGRSSSYDAVTDISWGLLHADVIRSATATMYSPTVAVSAAPAGMIQARPQ